MGNEEFVTKTEFNNLKEEVKSIKQDLDDSQKLLIEIDKKIDVISEKIISNNKIEDLKLTPLEKRVTKLEDSQLWLRRTIAGSIIAIVFEAIVFAIKLM